MNFNELKKLIESGNTEQFIQQAAISSNTLVSRDTEFGCSLLDWAAIYNRSEIVAFLCPTLLTFPDGGRSAIHYAARHGSFESLQILIRSAKDLEHKDQHQNTAIELAIQYKHASCARILLNHGARLPVDITGLMSLMSPFEFTLYCEPGSTYQFLNEEEIKLLSATEKLSTLTLHQESKYTRKPYSLKINARDIENVLLSLIDKYLYFCNRIYKETREEKHGVSNTETKKRVELSRAKRESLLKAIRLIVAVTNGYNLEQLQLTNDVTAKPHLLQFITTMQKLKQRYFGDDLSDNSDSDEEKAYLKQLATSNNSVDKKIDRYFKNSKRQTRQFWLKTKMNTPNNAGLMKKITTISANIKRGLDKETQLSNLKDIVTETLNKNLQERGKIEYSEPHRTEALGIIRQINSCPPEQLTELLKISKPIFILGTRGINYMLDRWNADARRYHQKIAEHQQPQYSESVLKTLPYDYYMDLDPTHDFHQNKEEELLLQKEALRLNHFLQSLGNSGPCISYSANHNGSYLFNSVSDCLQDHFSNGVDNHLNDLARKRSATPNYWGAQLKNSFNPAIAIGSRPYHALKYTFGLKDYYPHSMLPRYWNDGTIEYSHVGKVYLSLHSLEEILSNDGPHNISVQDRQARVSIGDQISPEKELSFLGFMPGDSIFHQFVAKFPSFNGPHKAIYEFKYGLGKEAYEAFQHLISITLPETNERTRVINLLAEWLCAYHEVLLVEIAKEEALRQGGILAYFDRDGKLTLEPENGRIFTGGQSNLALRNEVHIMRELRLELTQYLTQFKNDKTSISEFELVGFDIILKILESLLNNNSFLEKVASVKDKKGKYKVQLTTEEHGLVYAHGLSEPQIRAAKSKAVVSNLIKYGLYSKSFSTSYKKQITHLVDQDHLYTDLEINALLHQALDNLPHIGIYAPLHPLVRGIFGEHCQKLFVDALKRIFQINQIAVMPIEISQEELDEDAYLNIVGIHWNGLVISKINNNSFKIELIDPAHSPKEDINLTKTPIAQINTLGETVVKLLNLIQRAADESNVSVQIHWLATQQQSGDLDCGAWTVDNLIHRAQNLPLRTRMDITGNQLRQAHDNQYTSKLTF